MKNTECSTGIEYLDSLLGGIRIGDNLVWETDSGAYVDLFLELFARHSLNAGNNLIYVSFNRSPMTMVKRLSGLPDHGKITLVDCFTSGKGDNDNTFTRFYDSEQQERKISVVRVENPDDISKFTKILNELEEEKGEGARYIFDSITGMQSLWGDDTKTYRFFTYSCPRLYDLNTVAYWILEKEAHTPSFKANLEHVTQIALELSRSNEQMFLKVIKAEKRYSTSMFKEQKFEVWEDNIVFREAAEKDILDLGNKVKSLRLTRGLTQTELAQKINATASYISQLERNLISPSIDSLILLSSELHVDPGYFFAMSKADLQQTIQRKGQQLPIPLAGLKNELVDCQLLIPSTEDRRIQPMLITIQPNVEIPRHLFNHKGDEYIFILKGEIELKIDGKSYILREGDSIYLDSNVPDAWKNLSETPAQAIWILSPPIKDW